MGQVDGSNWHTVIPDAPIGTPEGVVKRGATLVVIPGRCEASNPESRDSGSTLRRVSRNDEEQTPFPTSSG
jgi:hypothetical protein